MRCIDMITTIRIQINGQNVYLIQTEQEAQDHAATLTGLFRKLYRPAKHKTGYQGEGWIVYEVDGQNVYDGHGRIPQGLIVILPPRLSVH